MSPLAIALTAAIAVAALVLVIFLVRRHRLRERYAFIWVTLAVGMLVLVVARPLLDRISDALGIRSGVTTLFVLVISVILGVLLQLSVSLTTLERNLQDLTEAFALHTLDSSEPVEESDQR
jgi:hypothetical protein